MVWSDCGYCDVGVANRHNTAFFAAQPSGSSWKCPRERVWPCCHGVLLKGEHQVQPVEWQLAAVFVITLCTHVQWIVCEWNRWRMANWLRYGRHVGPIGCCLAEVM